MEEATAAAEDAGKDPSLASRSLARLLVEGVACCSVLSLSLSLSNCAIYPSPVVQIVAILDMRFAASSSW